MFRRPKRPSHSIDMAPLIDVVFLLLVFFMLTSSFTPPSLPLSLPKARATGETPPPAPVVSIDASGVVALNGEVVDPAQLGTVLTPLLEAGAGKTVHFRGDRAVDYGRILDLMNRARLAGATQIHLIYESASEP